MEKEFLEDCLARGMSLDAIGERAGKHPSTVGYWLKKHGLAAAQAEKHAAKGAPAREDLTRSSLRQLPRGGGGRNHRGAAKFCS